MCVGQQARAAPDAKVWGGAAGVCSMGHTWLDESTCLLGEESGLHSLAVDGSLADLREDGKRLWPCFGNAFQDMLSLFPPVCHPLSQCRPEVTCLASQGHLGWAGRGKGISSNLQLGHEAHQ